MEYTLWRGQVLLGNARLEPSAKDSRRIRGPIEPTGELRTLGPIAQHQWPDGRLTQISLERGSDAAAAGAVQSDIEIIEVWESGSMGDEDLSPPEILPEHVITLRGPEGLIDTQVIWVIEPPALPSSLLQSMVPEQRERLIQWKLSCRLSEPRHDAA